MIGFPSLGSRPWNPPCIQAPGEALCRMQSSEKQAPLADCEHTAGCGLHWSCCSGDACCVQGSHSPKPCPGLTHSNGCEKVPLCWQEREGGSWCPLWVACSALTRPYRVLRAVLARLGMCQSSAQQLRSAPWIPAAAAAKSCQSCLTLCDPIDSSPPGSPVPGILQARTLEWVAISFFSA